MFIKQRANYLFFSLIISPHPQCTDYVSFFKYLWHSLSSILKKKNLLLFIFSQTSQHLILNHKTWFFSSVFHSPRIFKCLSPIFIRQIHYKEFQISPTFAASKEKPPILNVQRWRDFSEGLDLGKRKFKVVSGFKWLTGKEQFFPAITST